MQTLVLATRNAGKVRELKEFLGALPIRILAASDLPGAPDVEEDAPTLRGNALKKAQALFAHSGVWALADDTGLMVSALDGAPGVHSARFAGPGCTPADNRQKLLAQLADASDRSAHFTTVLALVTGNGEEYFEGTCAGRISRAERGDAGFGYDPIFVPEGMNRTFAELTPAEKNAISHRGRALRLCRAHLNERLR